MKKIFIIILFLSLIPLGLFFYSWNSLHNQLNTHILEDVGNLSLAKSTKTYYLTKFDGQRLAYYYFPVKKSKGVIILTHGFSNPGGKGQLLIHVEYLQKAGYTTVIPDLRSFGQSDGDKVTLGITEWQDISALYDYIKSLPASQNQKIGFMGVSMGATTVIVTAGLTGKGDFVIASTPFNGFSSFFAYRLSNHRFAKILYPFYRLAGYFELGVNYRRFTPLELISHVRVPIIIFSATHDESISSADSGALFQLANQPKEYWQADSGHDIFASQPDQFKQHVLNFLQKYTP